MIRTLLIIQHNFIRTKYPMCDYVKACIRREVYRKPSNTYVYLNEKSNGPQYLKDGILRGFLHRNDIVSSTPEAHAKELELLANIFIRLGMIRNALTGSLVAGCPRLRGTTPQERIGRQRPKGKKKRLGWFSRCRM